MRDLNAMVVIGSNTQSYKRKVAGEESVAEILVRNMLSKMRVNVLGVRYKTDHYQKCKMDIKDLPEELLAADCGETEGKPLLIFEDAYEWFPKLTSEQQAAFSEKFHIRDLRDYMKAGISGIYS